MRERLKRLKKNKDGFTLVELIVVLVILAILMGMLVPSLTGYIDMAHEKTALVECRQAVLAAQVKASEEYGKGNTAVEFNLSEIKELSEVPGTINKATAGDGKVTYLKYTSKRGIVVIYENGEYRIEGKDETSGGGESGGGDVSGGGGVETPDDNGGDTGESGGLDFQVGQHSFTAKLDLQKFWDESTSKEGNAVTVPGKGFYKVDNEYYYVNGWTTYNGETKNFNSPDVVSRVNREKEIIDYKDINWASKPVRGDMITYNGNYYIILGNLYNGATPSSDPAFFAKVE